MRLDLLIAEQFNWSKKYIKKVFKDEQVLVNGKILRDQSFSVDGRLHQVCVNGKILVVPKHHYYKLNKPKGYVTANKDKYSETVMNLVPKKADLFSVGRLDKNTTGLLLITDNGQLGYCLMQKHFDVPKEYLVKVNRKLTTHLIPLFEYGIIFDDGYRCKSAKLEIVTDYQAKVTITEGKRHQIKKMFLSVGYYVEQLQRIRISSLKLDSLPLGLYQELSVAELKDLYKIYEREFLL